MRAEQSAPPASTTRLPITLQETPQSATAISLQRLQDESLFSINDVMRNVTGVSVSFYDTQRPLYYARGFAITDFRSTASPLTAGPPTRNTTPPSTTASK